MYFCLDNTDNIKLKNCGPLFVFNYVVGSGEIWSAGEERNKKDL